MNWTASLLRNQLKKERLAYEKSLTDWQQRVYQQQIIIANLQTQITKQQVNPQQTKKLTKPELSLTSAIASAGKKKLKNLLGLAAESSESEEEVFYSPELTPLPEPIIVNVEPVKKPTAKEKRWQNIHANFTKELIQEWESKNFTLEACRGWININSPHEQNQAIYEANYYAWLRDIKKVDAEWVLNHGNSEQLRKEFAERERDENISNYDTASEGEE